MFGFISQWLRNQSGGRRSFERVILAALLCAFPALGYGAATAEKTPQKIAATPQLSEQEYARIRELFDQMSRAFLAGDAAAFDTLFVSDLKKRAGQNMASEFQQSRYLFFEILQVLPDDTLRENVHSVDVRFRFVVVDKSWAPELQDALAGYLRETVAANQAMLQGSASLNMSEIMAGFVKAHKLQERHPRLTEPNFNSTSQLFVVQKAKDGSFKIRDSSFFDNLGLRQGMGLVVEGLLAVMLLCAVLAFWVWMGWEALRARPRYKIWRWVVLVPVVGACAFFIGAYLPRQLKGRPN